MAMTNFRPEDMPNGPKVEVAAKATDNGAAEPEKKETPAPRKAAPKKTSPKAPAKEETKEAAKAEGTPDAKQAEASTDNAGDSDKK